MKCVICNGDDIQTRSVDEKISVGNDIVLTKPTLPICSQCGERYHDRKAMEFIEQIRSKSRETEVMTEDGGRKIGGL